MGEQVATRRKGGGAQVRAEKGGWTKARREAFLAELARTANVRASAASVGLTFQSAYALRQRDPVFADAWIRSVCVAYETVEMLLLERSIVGLGGEAAAPGDASHLEKLSERGMLALLNQHRQTVRDCKARAETLSGIEILRSEQTARERLEKKLLEMERRLKANPEPGADARTGDQPRG
ncbi:hypothetical protein [Sphingomonas sp. S2-65]|uniref:hypothetical protein n=1 Tax=Sphingomonas sp. S2-65 TaxID=2903960 RepID=UPI001F48EA02|nr:hypothetical protein [Sphingomonas sp. S2-65]UYY57519.1 hypothetical protein LZ586_12695 [Sphingomonas sp. S2-65]